MESGHRPMGFPPPILLLLVALLSASLLAGATDLRSDAAALLALRAAVGRNSAVLSGWSSSSSSPCNWTRITCTSGRVSELHLPGAALLGQIPPGPLANLTELRILSLRSNALSGALPSDIASLSQLRALYLNDNRFSGEIPASLSSLQSLVRLDLSRNQFSGAIPVSLSNLTRLATLYLDSNRLTGELPDLNLPALAKLNVSYNDLNGSIPGKLRTMPASAFLNTSLCGGPLPACPAEGGAGGTGGKLSGGAIAGIAIGSIIFFLALVILLVVMCRRMRRKRSSAEVAAVKPSQADAEVALTEKSATAEPAVAGLAQGRRLVFMDKGPKGYDLEDLLRASAEVLGKGTFGTSYKAVMENGLVVAVKRLRDVSMPEREFRERMDEAGAMRHPNLVPLRAYFHSRDEKLVVYDYMPLGSLSSLLHGSRGPSRSPLSWGTRITVALAAARGIAYIHSTSRGTSHGNIKSSNILLSKLYTDIRVSDHGLARLVGQSSFPDRAVGYRAPEVTDSRRVSQKSDVYSFGVLILELLTGKAPAQAILNEEGVDLPRWVQSVVEEEWTNEVFDLELLRYQDGESDMVQMLKLAIDCVAQYPDQRPSMHEVVVRLEEIHRSTIASGERAQQQHFDDADDSSPLTDS